MATIPDKMTWPKGTRARLFPARQVPEVQIDFTNLDFTNKAFRWIDDPNGKTVTASGVNGREIQVMGGASITPYNADWQEEDARAALLAQLGLAVPTTAAAPPIAPIPAPIAEPVTAEKPEEPEPPKAST